MYAHAQIWIEHRYGCEYNYGMCACMPWVLKAKLGLIFGQSECLRSAPAEVTDHSVLRSFRENEKGNLSLPAFNIVLWLPAAAVSAATSPLMFVCVYESETESGGGPECWPLVTSEETGRDLSCATKTETSPPLVKTDVLDGSGRFTPFFSNSVC